MGYQSRQQDQNKRNNLANDIRDRVEARMKETDRHKRWFNFFFYGAFIMSIAVVVGIIYVAVHFIQKYW